MNAYNVAITIQDYRTPPTCHEPRQVTVEAGNARAAATNALSRIGYGEVAPAQFVESGHYKADYHRLFTFHLFPYKLRENER